MCAWWDEKEKVTLRLATARGGPGPVAAVAICAWCLVQSQHSFRAPSQALARRFAVAKVHLDEELLKFAKEAATFVAVRNPASRARLCILKKKKLCGQSIVRPLHEAAVPPIPSS